MMTLGERLRGLMDARGMELKDVWRPAKLKKALVANVLSGRTKQVLPEALFALSDLMEVSPRWLALGQGPQQPTSPIIKDRFLKIVEDIENAVDSSGVGWTKARQISLAVDFYNLYIEDGEQPDAGMAVRLLKTSNGN